MTIARISEIIHERMGWCPNARMTKAKNSSDAGHFSPAGNTLTKNPGPSGTDGSGKPQGLYERTQRGSLIIGAISAAILLILTTSYLFGLVWVTVMVLGILILVLAICSTLTVTVTEDTLRIRFGPVGLIRKSWPLADIVSVMAVTNPWYYGWGIRFTPHGPLYNVSGYGAVEVRLISGKTFRIGTGEPDALCTAIEKAMVKKNQKN
jgi:hypothetical protein